MIHARSLSEGYEPVNEAKFLPFVLSVIDNMIEARLLDDDYREITFNSHLLNQRNSSDFILYKICERETVRISKINVDRQVRFFIAFAVRNLSAVNQHITVPRMTVEDFELLIRDTFADITETEIASLKGHSLIDITNDLATFRFDFHADHFKNIYLTEFLDVSKPIFQISDHLIIICASNAKHYSSFIKDISIRLNNDFTEDLLYRFLELIEQIKVFKSIKIDPITRYKAISGLFSLALMLKNKTQKFTNGLNTELLTQFFAVNGVIRDMPLIDIISFDHTRKTIFDFTGMRFENCYFDNYAYFWECHFNEKTIFHRCRFRNISSENIPKNIPITLSNFIDCDYDDSISQALTDIGSQGQNKLDLIISDFKHFFALFLYQGRLIPIPTSNRTIPKYKPRKLDLRNFVAFLVQHGIIEYVDEYTDASRVKITEGYKVDIHQYLTQGNISPRLNSIIQFLMRDAV